MKDILTIVDGNYLMIRCIMVNPNLRSSIGEPTGGIYLFLKNLLYLLKESKEILVCFDGGHNSKRVSLYPEYKERSHDEEDDADPGVIERKKLFEFSFGNIQKVLNQIGIINVRVKGEEADDLIFNYSKYFSNEYNVVVASDDADYLQMVTEDVKVFRPMKKDYITYNNFVETIGYLPKYHILYKSLVGDSSDNISSVCKGLGDVTARKIISKLSDNNLEPTVDNVIEVCKNSNGKIYLKLLDNIEVLKRNLFLIDISRVSDEESYKRYIRELKLAKEMIEPNPVNVIKTFDRYEFKTLSQWIAYAKDKSNK